MLEGEEIAFNGLEVCNYRHLQRMAKNMGLPSNVKKVHLIEMIRAKKYCTETDLMAIVDRIKMERKVNAQAKKKKPKRKKETFRVQRAEISSTSNSHSPPITLTPKRPSDYTIQFSPDMAVMRPMARASGSSLSLKKQAESDRVLRSFNSMKRPNYRIMEQNDYSIEVVSAQNAVQEIQEQVQGIRQECSYQSVNVTIHKQRPVMNNVSLNDRQLVPVPRSANVSKVVKRQRKPSGIYPLQTQEKSVYEYAPTVGFRRTDGRVTKINAVIQKPQALLPKNRMILKKSLIAKNALIPKRTLTVQDMINYKIDHSKNDINQNVETTLYQEIDSQPEFDRNDDYQWNDEREIEPRNYQVDSEPSHLYQVPNQTSTSVGSYSVPTKPEIRRMEVNRKVYKGQREKTVRNKNWNYSIDYQEHENDVRREWNVYDIDGQQIESNRKEPTEKIPTSVKDTSELITTNYKVNQGRITEPISRDYQVEYQKFNQELTESNDRYSSKNTKVTERNKNHSRSEKDRFNQNVTDTRSIKEKFGNQATRDIDWTRSVLKNQKIDQETRNVDLTRSVTDQEMNDKTQVSYQDTDIRTKITDQRYGYESKSLSYERAVDRTDKNIFPVQDRFIETDRNTTKYDPTGPSLQYSDMGALHDVFPNLDYSQEARGNDSEYYHKKIRAEHVKKRVEQLPRINEVFSQFSDVQYRNLTKPLFVQVSEESERVPQRIPSCVNSTCMLETIYNFKNQFVMNPPVLLIATTLTHCTYSTNTISTAVVQPAAAEFCNNNNTYERASPSQADYANNFLKPEYMHKTNIGCDEVLSCSTVSLETTNSQELGANVTICQSPMVEDALEIISQDGDYMERIGMDVRVQCMFCDWAGPKIILEYHTKKDHPNEIQHHTSNECSVLLTLGELVSQTWYSQLLQHEDLVYVLSAKYNDNDTLLLALSMISTEAEVAKRGRITVYNKTSGQPYTYEGEIKHLPDSMPYEYGLECLELDIGKLDLIPNSANLRLVNKELVGSPGKVIVGQPELNKVEIVVYVKFID